MVLTIQNDKGPASANLQRSDLCQWLTKKGKNDIQGALNHENMPITKSAKKRLKQDKKRRLLNLSYKRKMKKVVKEINDLAKEGKKGEAKKLLPEAYKAIDKAAKKGVIKENTASRKKSQLTRAVS